MFLFNGENVAQKIKELVFDKLDARYKERYMKNNNT
jgi:hypothetical protein